MSSMDRRTALTAIATATVGSIAGCTQSGDEASTTELRLAVPPEGSSPYVIYSQAHSGLEDSLPSEGLISLKPGNGHWVATDSLIDGGVELAEVGANTFHAAYNRVDPYEEEHSQLRTIYGGSVELPFGMAITKEYRDEHGVESLEDIVNNELAIDFATYPEGTTGEFFLRQWLSLYDATIDDLTNWGGSWNPAPGSDIISMFDAGELDAWIHVMPQGHPDWTQLTQSNDFFYIGVGDEVEEEFQEYNYLPYTVESSDEVWQETLSGIEDQGGMDTVRFYGALGTTEELGDEAAYSLAEAMHEMSSDIAEAVPAFDAAFDKESVTDDVKLGAPLHDGAQDYWDEAGLL